MLEGTSDILILVYKKNLIITVLQPCFAARAEWYDLQLQ